MECDCWSLTCGIKKKEKKRKKTKKHTFTKRIEDKKTNSYINERNKEQHDIGHWNWTKKVKIWETLHLSWGAIPGMDR